MTPAEEKGLVVGQYYARTKSNDLCEPECLVRFVKDTEDDTPWFQFLKKHIWPISLFNIRHLTSEEKSHILLGINPFTLEKLP